MSWKTQSESPWRRDRPVRRWSLVVFAAASLTPGLAESETIELADGNVRLLYDTGPDGGVTSFEVGGIEHLKLSRFYYRVGSEASLLPIQMLPLISTDFAPTGGEIGDSANQVTARYDAAVEGLRFDSTVAASGSGADNDDTRQGFASHDIRVTNIGDSNVTIDLVGFSDPDAMATSLDRVARLEVQENRASLFGTWQDKTDQLPPARPFVSSSLDSGDRLFVDVIEFELGPSVELLSKLDSQMPPPLNDFAGPALHDDSALLVRWKMTIPAGESRSVTNFLGVAVPEPTASAIVLWIGGLAVAVRTRERL